MAPSLRGAVERSETEGSHGCVRLPSVSSAQRVEPREVDMRQTEALAILNAGANVFLTGAPGAGKTYVLNEFIRQARADGASVAVTASTGIASTHINGQTIHSWSGVGV
ncbi:ATP-dependent endonuclease, partial [Bifidobacterium breve]